MTQAPKSIDDSAPSPRRYAFGCIGAVVAMILLVVALGWSWYLVANGRAQKELAAEEARIRARGIALTTVELNEKYQALPGDFDAGRDLIAALAVSSDPNVAKLVKPLPIVGEGPDIPALIEDWPLQAGTEEYLAMHARFLALIEEHTAKKTNVRYAVDLTPGVYTQLHHVQTLRHGSRVLTLQMHVDLRHGRIDEAIGRIEQDVFLAETLRNEPFLVAQLVRIAIIGIGLNNLKYLLENATLTDEQLARLQLVFRQVDMQQGLDTGFQGELAMGYTATSWPIGPLMSGAAQSPLSNEEIARLAKQPRRNPADAALMLKFYRRLLEAGDESLAQASDEADAIGDEMLQLQGSHRKVFYMHTLLTFPAVKSGINAFQRTSASCQAADTCLAALRFRQAKQQWPDTLAQLVPEYLPAIPTDPYTGKPMVFKATDQEFKVYALGENKTDDGGVWTDSKFMDVGFIAPWRTP
jgi:hypothetical protein